MKRFVISIICIFVMLFSAVSVQAEEVTMKMIMGSEKDVKVSEVWDQFSTSWENSFGNLLNLHPYYQFHLAYYVTLSDEELKELTEYMTNALDYHNSMINNPAVHKWDWVDNENVYHEQTDWKDVPNSAKAEALRSIASIYDAFDFTVNFLLPMSSVLKNDDKIMPLSSWFTDIYSVAADSNESEYLDFNSVSDKLRRNMMDLMGFENWLIK